MFTSERGTPFTTAGFARMVERAGSEAKLGFKTHPHMLRHACGYALANKGHDTRALQAYLGHRNIQHTATCILEKRKPVTDQDDRNTNVIGHVDALPFANKLSLIVARIVLLAVSKTPATVWVLILLFGTPTATTTLLNAVASFAITLVLTTSAALISLLATLILTLILRHHYSLVGISHGDPPARA